MTSPDTRDRTRHVLLRHGWVWILAGVGCAPTVCNGKPEPDVSEKRQPLLPVSRPNPPASKMPPELLRTVNELRRTPNVSYRPPSSAEAEIFARWIELALAQPGAETKAPEGFSVRKFEKQNLLLLAETHNQRGANVTILRTDFTANVFVEVPHSFFDAGTLPIGFQLFEELGARALLINTYHRGGNESAEERKRLALSERSPFDVAHREDSYFHIAHGAAVRQAPDAWFVQLHGFSTESAPGVDAIVSPGPTQTDVASLARRFRDELPDFEFRVYPDEIRTLGGTTNVQGQLNREVSAPFVHLELSARLRESLRKDPRVMARFARAFWAQERRK